MKAQKLRALLPIGAYSTIDRYLSSMDVEIKVVASRSSKFGDYRSSGNGRDHLITVNNDLNPYSFLVTLVHELAHYTTFSRTKRRIKPHGVEWKQEYRTLLAPMLNQRIFPEDLLQALGVHLEKAPASSCSDTELMRVLHRYDHKPGRVFVEDLMEGAFFRLNKKEFIKGPQLRKRFRCRCIGDRRVYFVDPLAEVIAIKEKTKTMACKAQPA